MNGRSAVLNDDGSVRKAGFGCREARRGAGREDLDLHDLRHTGATWAAEEGASIAELMYRLGHSTPSMAIHYQHSARNETARSAVDSLAATAFVRFELESRLVKSGALPLQNASR